MGKCIANMMVNSTTCAKHAGPSIKQSQLHGTFPGPGHMTGSASMCVRIIKVMEVQWSEFTLCIHNYSRCNLFTIVVYCTIVDKAHTHMWWYVSSLSL